MQRCTIQHTTDNRQRAALQHAARGEQLETMRASDTQHPRSAMQRSMPTACTRSHAPANVRDAPSNAQHAKRRRWPDRISSAVMPTGPHCVYARRTVLRRAPVRGSLQPGAVACRAAAHRRGLLWCRASGLRDATHRGAVAFACAVHGGHSAEHAIGCRTLRPNGRRLRRRHRRCVTSLCASAAVAVAVRRIGRSVGRGQCYPSFRPPRRRSASAHPIRSNSHRRV
jgi:hypothetical protein